MKLAFIAGPYRADTDFERMNNILAARAVAAEVWQVDGWGAICPHMNTSMFSGICDEQKFLDGAMEILSRCDAIVLMDGYMSSEGTFKEKKFALKHNIPVVCPDWDLSTALQSIMEGHYND
jgi:hypothetical protein